MMRHIHSYAGLFAALLVSALALSGAILSVEPVMDRASDKPVQAHVTSVATFAAAMQAQHQEIDRIVREPSGALIVTYFEAGKVAASRIDPETMRALGPHLPSPTLRFITNLHRSFLLGDGGRVAAGAGAFAMLVLTLSGVMMLATRSGGWRGLLKPVTGSGVQRWHAEPGRLAVLPLLVSAMTGLFMSLTYFGILPDSSADALSVLSGNGAARLPVADVAALQAVDLAELRALTFPYAADLTDVYTLTTGSGISQIDAATGQSLVVTPHTLARRFSEMMYMLHTGQGLWPLAILLGLAALCVPVFSLTGGVIWWKRQRGKIRITQNVPARNADTILLVGSEGNTTWGFARTLHTALSATGHRVHAAPMNAVAAHYPLAKRLLILTATYGDGAAPASARAFLARITTWQALKTTHSGASCNKSLPFAILGFGDRSFPSFCGFADEVEAALKALSWPPLLETHRIDRQSTQDFARWGERLGAVLGHPLLLEHGAGRNATRRFALVARADYGADVQAPTSILTFRAAQERRSFWPERMPRFEPGDLVGIYSPGSTQPRFYSLASSSADAVLEICVRKQPGGVCSGFLHNLSQGEMIDAFIRPNPVFKPEKGNAPLILIGAGAGIGPLVGFIRQNAAKRPLYLYWGGRNPASDYLYGDELGRHLATHRLTRLATAFSRIPGGGYVQDRLAKDTTDIQTLIHQGAQILVCGGRDMAAGVTRAIEEILAPSGPGLATLKAEGRYVEDVY